MTPEELEAQRLTKANEELRAKVEIGKARKMIAGGELFDDQELLKLREEAKAEVLKERKAKAKKLLLDKLKRDALSEADPNEQFYDYEINLPSFALNIMIDGVQYTNGQVYTFSEKQLRSVRDITQNAWRHEEAAFGKRDPNAYFKAQNPRISAASPGSFMRV